MKTLTYLPVNWVNGLKLTSQHFFANQYCQTEALNREAGRSLTSYNYGLGEVLEGIGDNLEIEISGDTMSTLCVRLKSCNAITKGGLPIVYYDGLYGDEKPCATISESGLQAEDSEYMVLISVDPYHLIPVGEPDPEEVPLHHPYVLPSIKLHIVPKNQVNKSFYSQNFLLVAEVCRQGNTYKINRLANESLYKRFEADPDFANQMEAKYPGIKDHVSPGKKGGFSTDAPPGTTWHHSDTPGILELVDRNDHQKYHKIYHPDGSGGRKKWGGGTICR